MEEVGGPVQRVDDPAQIRIRPPPGAAFLGQDGVVGVDGTDDFQDGLFGSPVHLTHEIVTGFFLHQEMLDPVHLAQNDLATPAGGTDGDIGDGLHAGSAV